MYKAPFLNFLYWLFWCFFNNCQKYKMQNKLEFRFRTSSPPLDCQFEQKGYLKLVWYCWTVAARRRAGGDVSQQASNPLLLALESCPQPATWRRLWSFDSGVIFSLVSGARISFSESAYNQLPQTNCLQLCTWVAEWYKQSTWIAENFIDLRFWRQVTLSKNKSLLKIQKIQRKRERYVVGQAK